MASIAVKFPIPGCAFSTLVMFGYQGVPLEELDRHLTTFNNPWGCYRYKRVQHGFVSSWDDSYSGRYDAVLADFGDKERATDDFATTMKI